MVLQYNFMIFLTMLIFNLPAIFGMECMNFSKFIVFKGELNSILQKESKEKNLNEISQLMNMDINDTGHANVILVLPPYYVEMPEKYLKYGGVREGIYLRVYNPLKECFKYFAVDLKVNKKIRVDFHKFKEIGDNDEAFFRRGTLIAFNKEYLWQLDYDGNLERYKKPRMEHGIVQDITLYEKREFKTLTLKEYFMFFEKYKKKSWLQKNIVDPLKACTPHTIGLLSIVATWAPIIPCPGICDIFTLSMVGLFQLGKAEAAIAMTIGNTLMAPIYFVSTPFFIVYGGAVLSIDVSGFSLAGLQESFSTLGIFATLQNFAIYIMAGTILWFLLAPVYGIVVYFISKNIAERMLTKEKMM